MLSAPAHSRSTWQLGLKHMVTSSNNPIRPVRVLLVDDHPLMREALRNLLSRQQGMEVVAEAANGDDACRLSAELLPDVVLLDISMPKMDGIQALDAIKAVCPGVAVLVLTMHEDRELIKRVLDAGGAGYLTKDVLGEQVIQAVNAAASGQVVLSASVSRKMVSDRSEPKGTVWPAPTHLTDREMTILRLTARGLSNSGIAADLGLSERTVRSHLEEVFSKLNVGSRTEAVAAALRSGLISVEDLTGTG